MQDKERRAELAIGIFDDMAATVDNEYTGKELQKLRIAAGMTQSELARAMEDYGYNWSQATIWALETGERTLKLFEARDILKALNLPWEGEIDKLLMDYSPDGYQFSKDQALSAAVTPRKDIEKWAECYFDALINYFCTYSHLSESQREASQTILATFSPESYITLIRRVLKRTRENHGLQVLAEQPEIKKALTESLEKFLTEDDIDLILGNSPNKNA
ncbi:helix-turn-helix domain-containing protein [Bifidobacterium catulorum]|uniref:HTH cro/C1-type domain-containing protein n=1 Tax=Bifidobacterium catulorum TaxID=1630173 RepID=A0A2U2MS66_9BIFI|nr:helix-turn-helix transcriptional regulator [Bifidobacterium catulorum]PWG59682.1 hypothetical protein DF200_06530 [Bifidobacterium catulorum]